MCCFDEVVTSKGRCYAFQRMPRMSVLHLCTIIKPNSSHAMPPPSPVSAEYMSLKSNKTTLFTKGWVDGFGRDVLRCTGPTEDAYVWREAGHGSNFNCESLVVSTYPSCRCLWWDLHGIPGLSLPSRFSWVTKDQQQDVLHRKPRTALKSFNSEF